MANNNLIVAGSRILASVIQSVAPLAVIKGADESVTSSTTMQNDDALFLAVAANAVYLFDCCLIWEGSDAPGDLQWKWTVPTSATLRYQAIYTRTDSASVTNLGATAATVVQAKGGGAGTLVGSSMSGTLITSSSSGTMQLQWAQNTSSSTATIVHAQSFLALWRVS